MYIVPKRKQEDTIAAKTIPFIAAFQSSQDKAPEGASVRIHAEEEIVGRRERGRRRRGVVVVCFFVGVGGDVVVVVVAESEIGAAEPEGGAAEKIRADEVTVGVESGRQRRIDVASLRRAAPEGEKRRKKKGCGTKPDLLLGFHSSPWKDRSIRTSLPPLNPLRKFVDFRRSDD